MKAKFYVVLIGLLLCVTVHGQVKIGDNPQNIHPSSVLELESTTRALVVTRITTAQMNAMVPLQGAVVYNTDNQCLHYYSGTAWINLCEALEDGKTFSANAVTNPIPTIIITETGNNVNFEVGQITGDNIVDGSINGAEDIQFGSVTQDNLALNSVGRDQLVDNAITPAEIDLALVTLNTFTNDAGFITGAGIVSTTAGNVITNDNGAYYSDAILEGNIAANTAELAAHIAADEDLDATNEIQNLAEVLTEGNAANSSITNLTNPVDPQDAATKFYVDNALAGSSVTGTPTSLFFADTDGTPITTEGTGLNLNQGALFWKREARVNSGALYIGLKRGVTGVGQEDSPWAATPGYLGKVVIAERLTNGIAYPLQIVNEVSNNTGPTSNSSSVGVLFSTERQGTFGKGALIYERNVVGSSGNFARGDFHFLQNPVENTTNPTITNAVLTVKNNGNVIIAPNSRNLTPQPDQKLYVGGNMRLTGSFFDSAVIPSPGVAGQILSSTGAGTEWINAPGDLESADGSVLIVQAGADYDFAVTAASTPVAGTPVNYTIPDPINDNNVEAHLAGIDASIPNGTSGSIFFADTDGSATENNANLFWDSTNNRVGIGTNSPTSTLHTGGSFATAIFTTPGNTTLNQSHHTIILGGNHTITLPVAASFVGRIYIIKNTTGSSQTITSYVDSLGTPTTDIPLGVIHLQSDGSNWQQIN